MVMFRLAALALLGATMASCAGGQPRGPSNAVIERALEGAPGAAQPSTIVSTELAYARSARENGWADASREFATADAVVHGRNGPVPLVALASAVSGSEIASDWAPRLVVKSCDGSVALSQGRFLDPEGFVGTYVTVWERQSDLTYRWTYDVAGRDDPQPPPRERPEEGDIVVTALNAVQGLVASCPRDGELIASPPAIPNGGEGKAANMKLSNDGTLRWRWEHRDDGAKYVTAEYFYEGDWVTAIEETLASSPE